MSRSQGKRSSSARGGPSALAWLREIAIVILGALIASTLLRLFIVQMFMIPSGSMQNTLQKQDRVAVNEEPSPAYTLVDAHLAYRWERNTNAS